MTPDMSMDLDRILGPCLPGYEPRAEQKRMLGAVQEAVGEGRHLIVEAGTGTGKSLAYLLPLVEHAVSEETRVVVSTYTKALQRQLVQKELPFIRDSLFEDLRFALCLGSDNYLCLRRLEQAGAHGLFDEDGEGVEALFRWAESTETGIRDGIGAELWHKVARESDVCPGKDCRNFGRCFYQRAKERERRSHVLVVNHHLYFANLASGLKVLPQFSLAVFDEAHELEDVAAGYLSHEVSNFRVRYLMNRILSPNGKGLLGRLRWLEASDFSYLSSILNAARSNADIFFSELSLKLEKQTLRIRRPRFVNDCLGEHMLRLYRELDALRETSGDDEEKRELGALALRCEALAKSLQAVLEQELADHVYWAERTGRLLRLMATPVDVAGLRVFQDLDAAVFTSATLSTGESFQYIRQRLGLQGAEELLLDSPFNYREQAVLYLARDLPEPNTPGFEQRAIERIREILEITEGRTLVLFTSYSMLNRAYEAIEIDGVNIMKQGDADSYRLIEELKGDRRSVIFGTNTFWQGIDVPGEALSCVVIVKLPFAVPDEPVIEARMQKLREDGKDPFVHYQVPQAALLLKQGFGRLIRTSTDRGVVAILDSRVGGKWYGKYFLRSLPPTGLTSSLEDVRGFLFQGAAEAERRTDAA